MADKRILITSPSLDVRDNVSGISSLVKNIMKYSSFSIEHFRLGSKDAEKKDPFWIIAQVGVLLKFFFKTASNSYDILHINTGLEKFSIIRDSILVMMAKKIFGKKILLHVHGGYYLMNEAKGITGTFLKKLFVNADAVIVLSEREKQDLFRRFGAKKYSVLPNAVDPPVTDSEGKRTGLKKRFVFLGRITSSKGIHVITESFKYLDDHVDRFEFDAYGAGPETAEWIKNIGQDSRVPFRYKGVVDDRQKWEVLRSADAFILPSIHSEGLPVAMLEAMAAGCVVVMTDDASISSVVENNRNGLIVSKNSAKELAARIKDIIDEKVDLKEIGRNAAEYVRMHLGFPAYISRLESIYAEL